MASLNSNHPTRYLVTGGAGFIGSHLVDRLLSRGGAVTVLDDLSTGSLANLVNTDARFIEGTTSDRALVDELVAEHDVVLHLASIVGVDLVLSDPVHALVDIVRGTDHVLTACAAHRRRVLVTSSSEVYGQPTDQGIAIEDETACLLGSPTRARWTYALGKGFGESLACSLYRQHGIETVVVRLFNTVGPRQTGAYGMVLARFVAQALAGKDLTVYGDGSQKRCFIHVADAVDGIEALIGSAEGMGGIYNIGTSTPVTILELAQRVIARAGCDSGIEFIPFDRLGTGGFEELARRRPDTTKLRNLTGWHPRRTLDDAIDDVIAHERMRAIAHTNGQADKRVAAP